MYEQELKVAKQIALQAGDIMLKYFEGDQQLEIKVDDSEVTIADKEINHFVIEELAKHFHDIIIGEEKSTGGYGVGRRWFCDPIDGTKGFVWGTPTSMFSLALVVDGVPVLGVAYDPYMRKLYHAVRGQGSFCNDKKLQVSSGELSGGYVALGGDLIKLINKKEQLEKLTALGGKLAIYSSVVHKCCQIASGRLVGYSEEMVGAHDMAAVTVIVEEAGGKMTGLDGKPLDFIKPFNGVVASNSIVHDQLVNIFMKK